MLENKNPPLIASTHFLNIPIYYYLKFSIALLSGMIKIYEF